MTWYILALVTMLETNKPDIKVNMSVKFATEKQCNDFVSAYKTNMIKQLEIYFSKIKVRHLVCMDGESAKQLQQQMYGDVKDDTES